jgi:putative glutamine amidotransferase
MSAPIIGITTGRRLSRAGYNLITVVEAYVQAVINAGGCPVLIPLGMPEDRMPGLVDRLDGVLFTGGGDIHPSRYAGEAHPLVAEVDTDRDRVELQFLKDTVAARRPFLGVCRGIQLVNVGLGGTLYEDIQAQMPGGMRHQYAGEFPRTQPTHEVNIESGSRLAEIIGEERARVNSFHHQGLRALASSLRPVAYAPDGLVEAVEMQDYGFGFAVQWHPEWLQDDPAMRRLFGALVIASQRNS